MMYKMYIVIALYLQTDVSTLLVHVEEVYYSIPISFSLS